MSLTPHDLGELGEQTAISYLREKGYRILRRNYRFGHNEIDIVALDNTTLCFIEVKTRSSEEKGHPLAAVTKKKQKEIVKAASAFLSSYPHHEPDCRFDVIAIIAQHCKNGRLEDFELKHAVDAFMVEPY